MSSGIHLEIEKLKSKETNWPYSTPRKRKNANVVKVLDLCRINAQSAKIY